MPVFRRAHQKSIIRSCCTKLLGLSVAVLAPVAFAVTAESLLSDEISPQNVVLVDEDTGQLIIDPPTPGDPSALYRFCDSAAHSPTLNIFVPPYDNHEDDSEQASDGWLKTYPTMVFFPGYPHNAATSSGPSFDWMSRTAAGGAVVVYVDYSEAPSAIELLDVAIPQLSSRPAYDINRNSMEGRCAVRWVKQLADLGSAFYPIDSNKISAGAHSWGTSLVQSLAVISDDLAQKEVDGVLIDLVRVFDGETEILRTTDSDPLLRSKFFYALMGSMEAFGLHESLGIISTIDGRRVFGAIDSNGVRNVQLSDYNAVMTAEEIADINDPSGFTAFRHGQWEQKWRAKSDQAFYYDSKIKSGILYSTGTTLSVATNCAVLNSASMIDNTFVTVPVPTLNGALRCGPYAETTHVQRDMYLQHVVSGHRIAMNQILSDISGISGDSVFLSELFDEIPAGSQMITPRHFHLSQETRASIEAWDLIGFLDLAGPKVPMLILNGDKDELTQWFEAAQLGSDFKSAGYPVEMVLFPGFAHGYTNAQHQILADVSNEFFNLDDESIHSTDGFGLSLCTPSVNGVQEYPCLKDITTNGQIVIGMPRTEAHMSSPFSWQKSANPYLSQDTTNSPEGTEIPGNPFDNHCGEFNDLCQSNYALYQGLSYQLDGLAFTENSSDKSEQLKWTLTLNTPDQSGASNVPDADCDADLCREGRSLELDLATANLVSGTYDLKVALDDQSVDTLQASIVIETHPMQANNEKDGGFGGYVRQRKAWFVRWTEVHWNDLSWSDGVARTGGWVTLKRGGTVLTTQNVSGVFVYAGHSSAIHELCLVGTDICSGPLPKQ